MKVIFLDFDGVLNSIQTQERIFNGMNQMVGIEPAKVKLVSEIAKKTGAVIVISSTWRHFFGLGELINMLRKSGLDPSIQIVGKTPAKMSSSRGYEIDMWLDDHQGMVESYVVLDDISTPHMKDLRQVLTTIDEGLTPELALKAVEILERS